MAQSVRALEFDPEAHGGRRKLTFKSCPLASIHALWHDSDPFIFLAGRLPDSSGCGVGVGVSLKAIGWWSYLVFQNSFLQRWPAGSTSHAKFSLFPGIVYRDVPRRLSLALTWTVAARIGHVLWEFRWPFLHHLTACHPVWKDLTTGIQVSVHSQSGPSPGLGTCIGMGGIHALWSETSGRSSTSCFSVCV